MTTMTIQETKKNPKKQHYWNFKKADWDQYNTELTLKLKKFPNTSDVEEATNFLNSSIITAAKHSIPRGFRKEFKPRYNTKDTECLSDMIKERRRLRDLLDGDPPPGTRQQYNKITAQINENQ